MDEIQRCKCCKNCEECPYFQNVVNIKSAGLIIYRYTARDCKQNVITTENPKSSPEILVLHNTKNIDIVSEKLIPKFDQYKKCPRCKYILEYAEKLLRNVPTINKFDILGICDKCRTKDRKVISNCKCSEAIAKFITIEKYRTKEATDSKQSKLRNLLKSFIKKDVLSKKSYDPSHLNTNIGSKYPERKKEFSVKFRTTSQRSIRFSDTGLSVDARITRFASNIIISKTIASDRNVDSTKHGVYFKEITSYPDETDKSVKLSSSNETSEEHDKYLHRPIIHFRKGFKDESPSILDLIAEQNLNRKEYIKQEINVRGTSGTGATLKTSTETIVTKYPSRDAFRFSLILKEEEFFKKDFSYFFIKEADKSKSSIPKHKSSSELIKDTQNMLREREEELKKKLNKNLSFKFDKDKEKKKKILKANKLLETENKDDTDTVKMDAKDASTPPGKTAKSGMEESKVKTTKSLSPKNALQEKENDLRLKEKENSRKDKIEQNKKEKDQRVKELGLDRGKEKLPGRGKEVNQINYKSNKQYEKVKEDMISEKTNEPRNKTKTPAKDNREALEKSIETRKNIQNKQDMIVKETLEILKDGQGKNNNETLQKTKEVDGKEKEISEQQKSENLLNGTETQLIPFEEEDHQKPERKVMLPQDKRIAQEEAALKLRALQEIVSDTEIEIPIPKPEQKVEESKFKELNVNKIKVSRPSHDNLIIELMQQKDQDKKNKLQTKVDIKIPPSLIAAHKAHKPLKVNSCAICNNSELELDIEEIIGKGEGVEISDIIIGQKICKYKLPVKSDEKPNALPIFETTFKDDIFDVPDKLVPGKLEDTVKISGKYEYDCGSVCPERRLDYLSVRYEHCFKTHSIAYKNVILAIRRRSFSRQAEPELPKGVIRYALSDRSFIDKGWTLLPTEKVVRKMNVYRMRPSHPEFDWFEHNKDKKILRYDTGERLAEFDDNGRGRLYYRSGRLALDYYDAEELNAHQRFVIHSSGELDARGCSRPLAILATFDYLGNGIVFDHAGKIRLKYNQTEGVVLDRSIGPVSHWKWHTLNDPPVLQQVMIDTQMAHKDPDILKLGGHSEGKMREDNEEMLAIEFDNFIKEKSKKLSQKFKPFQIKMKALKINEYFSLKVLDQASIYLIYRDGSTNIKINLGMILDHQEIVDTDTAEVGEVSNSLERFPARTDSLAGLQNSVAYAQRIERARVERERRIRPTQPLSSADKLTAASSRPLRVPLRIVTSESTVTNCRCRKPPPNNLYYDTRFI